MEFVVRNIVACISGHSLRCRKNGRAVIARSFTDLLLSDTSVHVRALVECLNESRDVVVVFNDFFVSVSTTEALIQTRLRESFNAMKGAKVLGKIM